MVPFSWAEKGQAMPKKSFAAEQIIHKLREAEVELARGQTAGEVCRALEIAGQAYYRWRRVYGGLKVEQWRRCYNTEAHIARSNAGRQHPRPSFPGHPASLRFARWQRLED